MTTVALWHLAATAVLAGALMSVILVQTMAGAVRRRYADGRPAVAVHRPTVQARTTVQPPATVQARTTVQPRTVRTGVRAGQESSPAMAAASGA